METSAYTPEDLGKALTTTFRGADEFARPAPRSAVFSYWRKCNRDGCWKHKGPDGGESPDKGWITIGPSLATDPLEYARYMREKHMIPLDQYGHQPTGEQSPATNALTRYAQILEQPGGLEEFPLSQIYAYGWDKLPIVRSMRPEVVEQQRIQCEHDCPPSRSFLTAADYKQHVRAAHSEASATDALGRALTKAGFNQPAPQMDPATIAAIVAAVMSSMEERRRPGRPPVMRETELAGASA